MYIYAFLSILCCILNYIEKHKEGFCVGIAISFLL